MNSDKNNSIACGIGFRIKNLRQALHMSQKDFAAKIDAAASQLSEIEAGKANPGYHFIMKVVTAVNTDANWLLRGTGEMFLEDRSKKNSGKEHGGPAAFEDFDFENQAENIIEMLDYCSKSPLVRICILAYFSRFSLNNEAIIKKDMKKFENKKNKDSKNFIEEK